MMFFQVEIWPISFHHSNSMTNSAMRPSSDQDRNQYAIIQAIHAP